VLNNIRASLLRSGRTIALIYKNPIFDRLLLEYGFKKLLQTEQQHADYPPFGVYFANSTTIRSHPAELQHFQHFVRSSVDLQAKQEETCDI
jgi:hypothetical protein